MTTVHEYNDQLLKADREAGRLLCRCRYPLYEHLVEWQTMQCARCGKKTLP